MTSISLESAPRSPITLPGALGKGIALLSLGFAIGYLVFGNPNRVDPVLAPASFDSAPSTIEDWHGNVRRSVPGN